MCVCKWEKYRARCVEIHSGRNNTQGAGEHGEQTIQEAFESSSAHFHVHVYTFEFKFEFKPRASDASDDERSRREFMAAWRELGGAVGWSGSRRSGLGTLIAHERVVATGGP